uniref:Uncharacterized protein n=1 Tax=Arundo donax TaxID=35708 RepID=A0A0A8YZ03_ARUDO
MRSPATYRRPSGSSPRCWSCALAAMLSLAPCPRRLADVARSRCLISRTTTSPVWCPPRLEVSRSSEKSILVGTLSPARFRRPWGTCLGWRCCPYRGTGSLVACLVSSSSWGI